MYTDGGCDDNRKSRMRSMGAQADIQTPVGWRFCVFEVAHGDSSVGLGRLKPTTELYGPVVTDGSDPLSMGADGHSNNTGELQAIGRGPTSG